MSIVIQIGIRCVLACVLFGVADDPFVPRGVGEDVKPPQRTVSQRARIVDANDPAPPPPVCYANTDCSAVSQYCAHPIGVCDGPGECVARPQACPEVWDPVCGCDGQTYSNACDAAAAGMNVAHDGPCEDPCEPTPDGFACMPNACSATIPEIQCIPTLVHLDIETGATTVLFCDCTDFNQCHIEFGNASPMATGYCPDGYTCEVVGIDTNNDGIDETFGAECNPIPIGACCVDIDDGPMSYDTCIESDECACELMGGIFHGNGTVCPALEACCVDPGGGTGYCQGNASPCCVDAGGVPLGSNSTCEDACLQVCGGIAGIPCENANEFCKLGVGQCCCDFQGICTPRPNGCPDNWDPVCGCDGNTYGNECEADAVGVSIDHVGECPS